MDKVGINIGKIELELELVEGVSLTDGVTGETRPGDVRRFSVGAVDGNGMTRPLFIADEQLLEDLGVPVPDRQIQVSVAVTETEAAEIREWVDGGRKAAMPAVVADRFTDAVAVKAARVEIGSDVEVGAGVGAGREVGSDAVPGVQRIDG